MYRMLFAVCLLMAAACSKSDKPANDDGQPDAPSLTTRRGQPIAAMATATIGAQGGQLASASGVISVTVPAGAVNGNQAFSIQEVENTLQPGKPRAFRLQPENLIFSKPVTIVMHYDPMDLTVGTEDVLRMAYQTSDGVWRSVPTALDKSARTLTATVTHFCDFAFYEQFELLSDKDFVLAGEKAQFKVGVLKAKEPEDPNDPDVLLLAPLIPHIADKFYRSDDFIYEQISKHYITSVKGWKVAAGPGTITPVNNSWSMPADAEYTAPTQISDFHTATVEVNLEGTKPIPDPNAPGGKRILGQLILRKNVTVIPDNYAVLSINGQEYNLAGGHTATAINGLTGLAAFHNTEPLGFTISVGAMTAGGYSCGLPEPGSGKVSVMVNYKLPSGVAAFAASTWCESKNNQTVTHYSSGTLNITRFGAPGEMVEGEWSGTLYQEKPNTSGCQFETKNISIRFRLKRGT